MLHKTGMRNGDMVKGHCRMKTQEKYGALAYVLSINGMSGRGQKQAQIRKPDAYFPK